MIAPRRPKLKSLFIFLVFLLLPDCGSSTSSTGLVLLPPGPTAVALGESLQFSSTEPVVIWTVIGGDANGTIDAFGLYQAPDLMPADPQVVIRGEFQNETTFAIIQLQP